MSSNCSSLSRRSALIAAGLCALLAVPAGAARVDDTPPPPPGDEPERLTAWPELSKDELQAAELEVSRLRTARTPEMVDLARAGLLALGAGAAPKLIEGLGKEKDEAAQARLEELLAALTDARHTRLLAARFDDKALAVRRACLLRAAAFPDPGTVAEAEQALARVEARSKKQGARDYDEREHDAAAMAATAAGSHAGLERMYALSLSSWGARWEALRAALDGARDAASTKFCAERLDAADRKGKVALINMLSGCGSKAEALPLVRGYLDDDDNSIRVAAINALRGIVDGDPPIEKLSVFDAIELAKEWKRRVA